MCLKTKCCLQFMLFVRQNYGFVVGRGSFFLVVDSSVTGSNLKHEWQEVFMQHCEISYYFSISVTTVGVHIDKHSLLALQNMKRCALLMQLDNSEVVVSYTIVEYREREMESTPAQTCSWTSLTFEFGTLYFGPDTSLLSHCLRLYQQG